MYIFTIKGKDAFSKLMDTLLLNTPPVPTAIRRSLWLKEKANKRKYLGG